jgi:hypothetical protein
MRRKRYASSMEAILQDRPEGFRLRYEWVPVRYSDRFEDARLLERLRRDRFREWLISRCVFTGVIFGGVCGAWAGFRLYGPNGATGGTIIGMILGGVLGLILPLLLLFAMLSGFVYALVCLLF